MTKIEIGRLLRASTTGCVVGCWFSQINVPVFGGMVRITADSAVQIYGIVFDIHVDDDGLVRQLISAGEMDEEIIRDNRENRNVPVEMSVLFIGFEQDGKIFHLIPPRPPLTLDAINACSPDEVCRFTSMGRFGYFRHILRGVGYPADELLAAHLRQASTYHQQADNKNWVKAATQELITLLRDDYATLMNLLSALGDAKLDYLEKK